MEKQDVINQIATLSMLLDSLNRADEADAIKAVVKKILDLIERL